MKPLRVAEDILPIAELKAKASSVVREIRKRGRAVVVTQRGKPAAVLLSPDDYDQLVARARFVAAVEEGLADVKSGRTVSDEDLGHDLDVALGKKVR